MAKVVLIFLFIFQMVFISFSQSNRNREQVKSAPNFDTLNHQQNDSLNTKGIKLDTLKKETKNRLDSIKHVVNAPQKTSDSLVNEFNRVSSSFHNKITQSGEVVQKALANPMDQTVKVISNPLDSLNRKTITSVQSLQKTLTNPTDSVTQSINKTLQKFQDNGQLLTGDKSEFLNLQNDNPARTMRSPIAASDMKISLPEDKVNTDLKISMGEPLKQKDIGLPGTKSNKLPSADLKDVDGVKDMTKLKSQTDEITSKLGQVDGYVDDLKNIKEGNLDELKELPKQAEAQAMKLAGVKEFQDQTGKFTATQQSYEALIQKYNDKKLLQQEMKSKSISLANEKFNKEIPEVKTAQSKMDKAKRKYGNFKSIKNLPVKRVNEMRGKPFYQRVVPGFSFQVFHSDKTILDLAPQVGYRFTSRFTSGFGYTYRFGLDKDFRFGVRNQGLYGARAYAQFNVVKNFFVQGETEYIHITTRGYNNLVLLENRKSDVLQANLAIGKFFNLSPKIRGYAMALYRLEFTGTLPQQNKLNLRFGVDYMFANLGRSRPNPKKGGN